ncbi:hypothetical protein BASA62_002318 [Batrachochytrium salamandrivorans]|nr:hypothetical protein BASA62_002318 [Batrachochytrium salamandrivorans]
MPTALLQLCDIALDDGPLLPVWPLKGANTEHSRRLVPLASNTLPALAPSAAMVISAPAATTKRGSTAARSKKAASINRRGSTCKVATQPVVEELVILEERLEVKEEENKDIGSTSAVRRPYRTSKKPANTLATAGDTMPTEDGLKAMAQRNNSGRRRCNARSDLGLTLVAAAPPSLSSLPARLKNKRAATEFTDLDTAAPKRLCKS